MKVTKTLQPGADGTKRYQRAYGERLVCVRYRRDAERQRRVTTVELVVEESQIIDAPATATIDARNHPNTWVYVCVAFQELDIRARVRAAGATWNRHRRAWHIRYGDVLDLGLRDRVLDDTDLDI